MFSLNQSDAHCYNRDIYLNLSTLLRAFEQYASASVAIRLRCSDLVPIATNFVCYQLRDRIVRDSHMAHFCHLMLVCDFGFELDIFMGLSTVKGKHPFQFIHNRRPDDRHHTFSHQLHYE